MDQTQVIEVGPDLTPTHHISLGSLAGDRKVGLILDDARRWPAPSWVGGENNIRISGSAGRYGEHGPGIAELEWVNWAAGRGVERFIDQPNGFYDSHAAWTMTPGVAMAAPQWHIASGWRGDEDRHLPRPPRSVHWQPLLDNQKVIETRFTASASYTIKNIYLYIRRKGTPSGQIKVHICSDSGGDILASLSSTQLGTGSYRLDDWISVFHTFTLLSGQAVTSSTDYHIAVEALGTTDDEYNCWEVGVEDGVQPIIHEGYYTKASTAVTGQSYTDVDYRLYFRTVEAETTVIYKPFTYQGALYAYSYDLSGSSNASKIYQIGYRGKATSGSGSSITDTGASFAADLEDHNAVAFIYSGAGKGQSGRIVVASSTQFTTYAVDEDYDSTSHYVITKFDDWAEITSTGITNRIEDLVVINDYVLMCFGNGVTMRKMRYNTSTGAHDFRADGNSNDADMLLWYQSPSSGPKILRIENDTNQASYQDADTYTDDLDFGDAKKIGSSHGEVSGLTSNSNYIYAFKTDGAIFYMQVDTNRWVKMDTGTEAYPDQNTGVGAFTWNMQLYWPYGGFSLNRMLGANIDDIGTWQGAGLPLDRRGYISDMVAVGKNFIAAISGAYGNYSSVMVYDNGGWHELFRGWQSNIKIRNLCWEATYGHGGRLWFNYGGDLIYMDFPEGTHNPEQDQRYYPNHEYVLSTPTFDLGSEKEYKSFHKIATVIKRTTISSSGSMLRWAPTYDAVLSTEIHVDAQYDEAIGEASWIHLGLLSDSPFDEMDIDHPPARKVRYRLRIYNQGINCWLKAFIIESYAKVPNKLQWTITAKVSDGQVNLRGGQCAPALEIWKALRSMAEDDLVVYMRSVDPMMDQREVIVGMPVWIPQSFNTDYGTMAGRILVNVRER